MVVVLMIERELWLVVVTGNRGQLSIRGCKGAYVSEMTATNRLMDKDFFAGRRAKQL